MRDRPHRSRFRARLQTLGAIELSLLLQGCYSTWEIRPSELSKLEGFRAPQTVELADVDGEAVVFDDETELTLTKPSRWSRDDVRYWQFEESGSLTPTDSAEEVTLRFVAADVRDRQLTVRARRHEESFSVDLSTISEAELRKFSTSKTVAVSVCVPLAVAAVVGATVGAVFGAGGVGVH